jgi:hypothetical protein
MHTKFLSENLKGRDHSGDLEVDVRVILEWILGKQDENMWTGCIWIRIETDGGGGGVTVVNAVI